MAEEKVKEKIVRSKTPGKSTTTHGKYISNTGHPLTVKEYTFIQEYIKTGNQRQSFLKAYGADKLNQCGQNAYDLLKKDYVEDEINYLLEVRRSERQADADEIFEYFTSVMRGEIKDTFGFEASLSERTKAAQELAKRKIDIPQNIEYKRANQQVPELKITLNWDRGEQDGEPEIECN